MKNFPTISIIIPRKAEVGAEQVVQAILKSEYPQNRLEILEVIGEQPSKQRNAGADAASGEILYFLDNDSIITPGLFARVAGHYTSVPELAGVGGPNLTPSTDNFLQHSFGAALASPFAHFRMNARYTPVGTLRRAGEQELILCNLSMRREIFLQEGGLNEALYPNEENELINRLTRKGYYFLYDPDVVVYRSRRSRFRDFFSQFWHYGRGRTEQMRIEGISWNALLFFAPLGFLAYFCTLPLLIALNSASRLAWLPLIFYSVPGLLCALRSAIRQKQPWFAALLPLWTVTMHLAYGIGMLAGFCMRKKRKKHGEGKKDGAVRVIIKKTHSTTSLSKIRPSNASTTQ